jgi:hypothetical protein
MIEVYKTNIIQEKKAALLINAIHQHFREYVANFDIKDCDHILRVDCTTGPVDSVRLQSFLHNLECYVEILSDEIYSYSITPANALSFISRFYHPS